MQRVAAAQAMFHSQLQESTSLRSKMQDWASNFGYQKPYFKRSVALTAELRTNADTDFYHKFWSAGASCHNTPSDGAVTFQGDHGTAAASSNTKRYGPGQLTHYFKHILNTQAKILATNNKTQYDIFYGLSPKRPGGANRALEFYPPTCAYGP